MLWVLGSISCDLDTKVKVKMCVLLLLLILSPPQQLDVATSNFTDACVTRCGGYCVTFRVTTTRSNLN